MELNTPMEILAFCISSFQSSWHFIFYIQWDLNTALVKFASKSNWFRLFLVLFSSNRISTGFAFSSDMPPGN